MCVSLVLRFWRKVGGGRRGFGLLPIPDQPDVLPSEIHAIIPIRRMHQRAPKCIKPRNIRPFPLIQQPARVDEDIAVLRELLSCAEVANLDIVPGLLIVPVRADDLVLCFDEVFEMVLVGEGVEVVEDLLAARVDGGVVWVRLEAEGVVVRGDVAGDTTSAIRSEQDIKAYRRPGRSVS